MRKNILALSISTAIGALGLVSAATAGVVPVSTDLSVAASADATKFVVNSDGIGHVLVVPYFSVQNGNSTLLNLVNTDSINGKAVKIRFRGASNSDDIFDFLVFMSPNDVWTANISVDASGLASLKTSDKSCTLPANVNQSFVTARLPVSYTGDRLNAETREGYIEIFNTADIRKPAFAAQLGSTVIAGENPLYTTTLHRNGVPTCDATILARTEVDTANHTPAVGIPSNAAFQGFTYPTTGLFANWTIINVPNSNTYTGSATAVVATTAANFPGAGNMVAHPQTSVGVTNSILRTADPLLAGGDTRVLPTGLADTAANGNVRVGSATDGIVSASYYDFPDLSTPYVKRTGGVFDPSDQAFELTKSLATVSVNNEYLTDQSISAKTDWVFSSPTRRYYVGMDYSTAPFRRVFTLYGAANKQFFHVDNTFVDNAKGQVCVSGISQAQYDREEGKLAASGSVISPGRPTPGLSFCGEVSVLTFNNSAKTTVLGASLARTDITSPYQDGWVSINTPGNGGIGLPILGASFESAFNPRGATGNSGNFGLTFPHRFNR
jgi:hypothetical protein